MGTSDSILNAIKFNDHSAGKHDRCFYFLPSLLNYKIGLRRNGLKLAVTKNE
jgi:hypothetical protein